MLNVLDVANTRAIQTNHTVTVIVASVLVLVVLGNNVETVTK